MPGASYDDYDVLPFYNNEEEIEVNYRPGVPSSNPGDGSDLGGRRQQLPDQDRYIVLRNRRIDNLGPNLATTDNASEAPNNALDVPGDVAKIDFVRSQPLTAYVEVDSWDLANIPLALGVSPLAQPASGGGLAAYQGGAVSLAQLQYGHKGTMLEMIFDCPPGMMAKATVICSSARLKTRLAPKYYYSTDGAKRTYFIDAAKTIALTSSNFNQLPPNVMQLNGFSNTNAFKSRGFIAEGSLSTNNELTLPKRRFYGSVKQGAVANLLTNCPIAWNAIAVTLTGGLFTAPATVSTLKFVMNTITGQTLGPYGMNQTIPLVEGVSSIDVFNDIITAADTPFELVYILG
jgi:hypothetical protein